jgi:hypothetical protein
MKQGAWVARLWFNNVSVDGDDFTIIKFKIYLT